jgi:UrcA family protein
MTMSPTRSIALCMLAAVLALGQSHAKAGPQPDRSLEPHVTVQFGDLKTSTAEGIRVLYERINSAADAVCSRGGGDWYPAEHWARQECVRATVDHVVRRLDLPRLTAMHRARVPHAPAPPALSAGNR